MGGSLCRVVGGIQIGRWPMQVSDHYGYEAALTINVIVYTEQERKQQYVRGIYYLTYRQHIGTTWMPQRV